MLAVDDEDDEDEEDFAYAVTAVDHGAAGEAHASDVLLLPVWVHRPGEVSSGTELYGYIGHKYLNITGNRCRHLADKATYVELHKYYMRFLEEYGKLWSLYLAE